MRAKMKIGVAVFIKMVFYIVAIPIFVTAIPLIIDYTQMQIANEASFRQARERASEIEEMVIGLTHDEIIDILGPGPHSFIATGVPGRARAHWYFLAYEMGMYYEWNSSGQNFRQRIRIVLEMDEKEGTIISTFMIRQVGSSRFVVME